MCLCSFRLRKKGRKIFQKLKKRAGGLPNHKGDSAPAPESAALSELSSLTEKVAEEAGSRDVVETTKESTGSPLEPSVLGVGVLSSAATFCCGGQEATNKAGGSDAEKSCTAGASVKPGLLETSLISHIFHLPQEFSPFSLRLPSRPRDVVRVQSGRCDVCSAAGSAVCRKGKGGGKPSAGRHQGFAQTGCLARPVTREVRCQATSRQIIIIIQDLYETFYCLFMFEHFFLPWSTEA